MPVSPTITTRPFIRLISAAWLGGAEDLVEAVTITASAPWPPVKPRSGVVEPVADRDIGAQLQRQRGARRVGVEAEHAAAIGLEQLHGKLADQPEPHDDDALAERRVGDAHALQRDRAERDEARLLVVDAGGDADQTGSSGTALYSAWLATAGAGAGDAVADRVAAGVAARLDHRRRRGE